METFEKRWVRARRLEMDGELEAACDAYEQILADEPNRLYARLRLCDLLQARGSYRAAHTHLIRAMQDVENGKRPADLHQVTRRLLAFAEHAHVQRLIEGADWHRPEIAGTAPMLIQYLWLSGKVESALRRCEQMLEIAPDHAALNYSHGILLNYSGRIDEAEAAFERCIQIQPGHPGAHWSLAYLRASPEPLARVQAIEHALALNSGNADSSTFLHYALHREYANAGKIPEAWHHLGIGAGLKRAMLSYDSSVEEMAVEELLALPPPGGMGGTNIPKTRQIFVVGMPRTGTTLLERILGGDPRVVAAGELTEFQAALGWQIDRFVGTGLAPGVMGSLKEADLEEVGRRYRDMTAWRMDDEDAVLVDKNPENFFLSPFIAGALPEAKIVCIRRNPMDACFSNLKELFANDSYGYSYRLDELADHYHRFNRLAEHWKATMPGSFHVVEYEYLVSEPVAASAEIFAFCGLHFDGAYVDITRNSAPVATASAAQVRRPIESRSIGSWKEYATELDDLKLRLEMLGHAVG